jgi:NAD-dependent SIR2 family protein deacetylase
MDMNDQIEKIAELIVSSKRIVVFVGAGLSTESGIPDFRSPGGVWDKYDPEDFYFQNFVSSEASREKYWQMATEMYEAMRDAKPNQHIMFLPNWKNSADSTASSHRISMVFTLRRATRPRRFWSSMAPPCM